jgi:hypothetical protein
MLRELEGSNTEQDRAANVTEPITDRGGHLRKGTAWQGILATAALIAAALVAVVAWQPRAVEVTEQALTTTNAKGGDADQVPSR